MPFLLMGSGCDVERVGGENPNAVTGQQRRGHTLAGYQTPVKAPVVNLAWAARGAARLQDRDRDAQCLGSVQSQPGAFQEGGWQRYTWCTFPTSKH